MINPNAPTLTFMWDGEPLILKIGGVEIHAQKKDGRVIVELTSAAQGNEPIGQITCTEDGQLPVAAS
jgi:hypothetical protein